MSIFDELDWTPPTSATIDEIEEILHEGDVETVVPTADAASLIFCELAKSRWGR